MWTSRNTDDTIDRAVPQSDVGNFGEGIPTKERSN
jgi:hypothetical protein